MAMSLRPEIWLSDLFEVKKKLGIEDDDALTHLVRVLDIRLSGHVEEVIQGAAEAEQEPVESVERQLVREEIETASPPPAEVITEPPELEPVGSEPWSGETDWQGADTLAAVEERHLCTPPVHLPLLSPIGVRPILSGMLATDGPGGEIDVDKLVEVVANARPVTKVPYHVRPSLFRGVRVLADLGTGMQAFYRDQMQIIAQLRDLVGRNAVEVQWYEDSPTRSCGSGPVGSWRPFEPPHPDTPVLVLGDLGIGGGFDRVEQEWLALAGLLERRESRLTALVPYHHSRWPPSLMGCMDLIVWDYGTTISDITFRVRK